VSGPGFSATSWGGNTSGSSSDHPRLHGVTAVLWSQNPDTRLLFRGLLRLYQCPTFHEAETRGDVDALQNLSSPTVLIVDAEAQSAGWEHELPALLQGHPELRTLVVLGPQATVTPHQATAAGAVSVLHRPFSIHDFVRAVASAAESPPSGPSTGAD
jgi:DNA-binding NarL/FixJ family response regulator